MTLSAVAFLLITGIVLPLAAYASKRRLDAGLVFKKIPFYVEAMILQGVLLAFSIWTARRNGVALPFGPIEPLHAAAGAIVLVVAMLAMMAAWRKGSAATRQRLAMMIPGTPSEKAIWIFVSIAAGISEEITYRGAMFGLLSAAVGVPVAVVATSCIFGLAHLVQGWRSSGIVMLFGLVFQLLTLLTGGLAVAVAIHFVYDLAAGFILAKFIAEEKSLRAADL